MWLTPLKMTCCSTGDSPQTQRLVQELGQKLQLESSSASSEEILQVIPHSFPNSLHSPSPLLLEQSQHWDERQRNDMWLGKEFGLLASEPPYLPFKGLLMICMGVEVI